MKANQAPRRRRFARLHRQRAPDGGQMLLLAGFLLAGTAIIAIGAFTALQRNETSVIEQRQEPLINLFLNTRDRAVDYFNLVTANDTFASAQRNLDDYLASQFQSAHSLSLELNATLAGKGTGAPLAERDFTDQGGSDVYQEASSGDPLWSHDGAETYTCSNPADLAFDGSNDGLIVGGDGRVLAAIFYIEVSGVGASMEEFVIIDVPATTSPCP